MRKNYHEGYRSIGMMIGGSLLVFLMLMAFLGPVFSPCSYEIQDVTIQNVSFTKMHLFGTDKFGRDIFVRCCMGIRLSLYIGIFSTGINLFAGIILGGFAGYYGGIVDTLIMRVADILSAIPSLLYMVLIMLLLPSSRLGIVTGLCVAGWTGLARVIRLEVLKLRQSDYCIAARMSGMGNMRILYRQLLPNMRNTILIMITYMIPQAIFSEAFLSFVGIGISAPMASLGTMIQEARSQIQLYPMQMGYPILVLCLMIFSFHIIGVGLESDR